ncbi:dTDP-4-dehydrorhamnose reductase [Stappia sp. GBMRC 2046]|uniref:dTDP-4-dehydrorhamnose reductase n=1 Tax=Stappia sediminis TaxID=2692190 RepID=A0A7X3S9U3_9HYPH|nr:dTDP-4-dehydrorhamnose reductase [Stappia sediminis]MXN67199.1 dTDP-4-dehydrorhamnose reductase [Stappia sediminis]
MDILLTGAGGQLGVEIARQAGDSALELTALAHHELDVSEREAVLDAVSAVRPRVIINAAAYTAVDDAEADRQTAFAVNSDGPANLAEAAEKTGATLVHISTDYVFDGSKSLPYAETDETSPINVYGESKLAGETAVQSTCARHVILRTSWLYGLHGGNFVKTMLRLGKERDVLRIVSDQTGCPTYTGDLAAAILSICRRHVDGNPPQDGFGLFHYAGAGQTSWYEFAREIFRLSNAFGMKAPRLEAIATTDFPAKAPRPQNSALECSKIEAAYGLRARPWRSSLAGMLDTFSRDRNTS